MEEEVKSITKETYQNKDSFFSRNHRLHLRVSLRPYEFLGLLFSCPCDPFYWKGISMFVMSTGSVCYGLLRQKQEIHGGFKLIIQRDKERCWMKNQATQNLNSSKSLGIMNGIPLLAGWIPNLLDGFAWICCNEKLINKFELQSGKKPNTGTKPNTKNYQWHSLNSSTQGRKTGFRVYKEEGVMNIHCKDR